MQLFQKKKFYWSTGIVASESGSLVVFCYLLTGKVASMGFPTFVADHGSIEYICKMTENYFKLFHKTRFRFLEKKPNDADTTKLKFAAIETLLGSEKKQTLPSVFPRVELANKYMDFLLSKFQNILKNIPPSLIDLKIPASGDYLETFENVHNLYVVLDSNLVSSKSQPSQKVPSRILKKLSIFHNQMSEIINESFLNAVFPTAFKHGIVIPIYKRGDIEEISNNRPITNLHFTSKVIKKVIALQLRRFWINMQYLTSINLCIENIFQQRQRY